MAKTTNSTPGPKPIESPPLPLPPGVEKATADYVGACRVAKAAEEEVRRIDAMLKIAREHASQSECAKNEASGNILTAVHAAHGLS